jgi:hypothetical protein
MAGFKNSGVLAGPGVYQISSAVVTVQLTAQNEQMEPSFWRCRLDFGNTGSRTVYLTLDSRTQATIDLEDALFAGGPQ